MQHSVSDQELLITCQELIARKLSWPPATEWRSYEFSNLSEKILEATGVGLSSTTLKRLFGKIEYNNTPSSTTLNAIANYLGYESWMQFRAQQGTQVPPLSTSRVTASGPVPQPREIRRRTAKPLLLALTLLGFLVICGFVFFKGKNANSAVDYSRVVFTSRPVTAGLPNSVVFKLNLEGIKSDDVLIQQSWDSTKTIRIKPGQTEATGIYYRPGYFRAKLIVDGKIIKEHDLFIKSENWMGTIDLEPVPVYLSRNELIDAAGKLDIAPSVKETIRKLDKPVTMTYHLVKPFAGLRSDNFRLEASIRNTWGTGAAICKTTKLYVLCTKGAFIVPFSIPGCVSDINLMMGEKLVRGKENDLSAFGIDVSVWTDVKVEVVSRHVRIYANEKIIWEDEYKHDVGEIVGVRVQFLGAGMVKGLTISHIN